VRFDHLADPAPPVPDRATRAAVAERARRLGRRRAATRGALVVSLAAVVLVAAVGLTRVRRPDRIDAADTGFGVQATQAGPGVPATPADACCPGVGGTVTDQVGVLARVVVQLIDPQAPPAPAPPTTAAPSGPGWQVVARTVTGADGAYRLTGVPPGRYALRFEDQFDPLAGTVRHHPAFLGGGDRLSQARLVDVVPGAPVRVDQRLELSPIHVVRGSVREGRRQYPVRDVTVRLFTGGELVRQTHTDDQGRYDFGGVRPGDHQVAFLDETARPSGSYLGQWAGSAAMLAMTEDRDLVVDAVLVPAG
jgi:hypothetical protein